MLEGTFQHLPGWAFLAPGKPSELPLATFHRLRNDIEWEQHEISMFGRQHPVPRLTAWFGESGYRYSGIDNQPQEWHPIVAELRDRLRRCDIDVNSCLANLYRDGKDSVGWHSDDERGLGPVIASVSFGATRLFRVRSDSAAGEYELKDGDLFVMHEAQRDWEHQVPKQRRVTSPRISLTFRSIQ